MRVEDIRELHFIAPLENLSSILQVGILSHRLAEKIPHRSIAMTEIQDTRAKVIIPGAGKLHEYANLYFNCRNTMMYKRREQHQSICVVRISPEILYLKGVIISDQNAASGYARFHRFPDGLRYLDYDTIFARSWVHNDQRETWRHKAAMCAEVLVPNKVEPKYIMGGYVSSDATGRFILDRHFDFALIINPDLFFL